jgi:hypothetical protein
MSGLAYRLTTYALFFVSFLSPLPLIIWAWIRQKRGGTDGSEAGWRPIVGWSALWLVTAQLVGSLIVLVFVLPHYEFPRNLDMWLAWSRIVLIMTPIVLFLSLVGQTRARIQILFCSLTTGVACVMWATLA